MAAKEPRVDSSEAFPEDIPCGQCRGSGTVSSGSGWTVCPVCEGSRLVPTKFGEQVLEFLSRHQ